MNEFNKSYEKHNYFFTPKQTLEIFEIKRNKINKETMVFYTIVYFLLIILAAIL